MSRIHCRCADSKCRARKVLLRHPESYYRYSKAAGEFVNRAPACRECGKNEWKVDAWMNRRDMRGMACNCSGYVRLTSERSGTAWEFHRKGSKYCWFRKDGTQRMPGDEDFHDIDFELLGGGMKKQAALIAELPDFIPRDAWDGWVSMRIEKKKPMTDRAVKMAFKKLAEFHSQGYDVGKILEQSEFNNWTDLYAPKDDPRPLQRFDAVSAVNRNRRYGNH